MKYNIAFFVDSIPFSKEEAGLKTPKGLGGSESALIMTANALAKRGHNVHMFSTKLDPSFGKSNMINGVFWTSADRLLMDFKPVEWDVFISQRQLYPFHFNSKYSVAHTSYFNVLWHEDFILNSAAVDYALPLVDANFFVSEWQRDNFADKIPYIRKNSLVTRNAIDFDWISKYANQEKDEYQIIAVSRPERHIEYLAPIFLKLKKIVPELKLKICRYYSMYEPEPNMQSILEYHDSLIEGIPDVEFLGNLSKDRLYEQMGKSKLLLYPTAFDETSCIAAIEAQAIGLPMVTTNRGALKETLHDSAGIKVNGDPRSDEYQIKFIEETLRLLTDDELYKECVNAGVENSKKYDASVIAEEWENYFNVRFERRFQGAKQKVYDNLIWYDDVLTAEYLAEKYPTEVTPIPKREVKNEITYTGNIVNPVNLENDPRFLITINRIPDLEVPNESGRVLDFACNVGAFTKMLAGALPDHKVVGMDYAEGLVEITKKYCKDNDRIEVVKGSVEDIEGKFDLIFLGEILEHRKDYIEFLEKFNSHLSTNGVLVITVPTGPFAEMVERPKVSEKEGHVIAWTLQDIRNVFGGKDSFDVSAFSVNIPTYGYPTGHYIITHKKGGEFGSIDFEKKIKTFRPKQELSVGIVSCNNQKWIRNCIESVLPIADELIVCDTGSTDKTIEIAKEYTDKVYSIGTCPYVPEDTPPPGAFDWIKNKVLDKCTGDWFLCIDTDEELVEPFKLRKYLKYDSFFDGFNIKQVHLQQDKGVQFDLPVRLFKNDNTYQYFGVLHEQPQRVDNINRSVYPHLILEDTNIAHYGYLTESHRSKRAANRNIFLMDLDRTINPNRELGHLLHIRESINKARMLALRGKSSWGLKILKDALEEWRTHFSNPNHRLYRVGIDEVYRKLLEATGQGTEATFTIGRDQYTFKFDRLEHLKDYILALTNNFKTDLDDEYQEMYKKIQEDTEITFRREDV